MGGVMSGLRWSKKRVVEGCLSIDTADLKRMSLLVPGITNRSGSLNWKREGEKEPSSSVSYLITVGDGTGTLRLLYKTEQPHESIDYSVWMVSTECHLGGVRWWFLCPLLKNGVRCNRRVRKLYVRGKYFGCRHCHQLTYSSSQQSDSRVYAAMRNGTFHGNLHDMQGWSVSQLGFVLKVLALEQKRLDRMNKRMSRTLECRESEGGC